MDWINYIPTDDDVQVSLIADFLACGSYSAVHIAEMLTKKWTGQMQFYSERALAKLSGTTHQGNSLNNIVNAINKYGLILEKDWPQININADVTWDEYYAEIPTETLAKADKGWKADLTQLSPSAVIQTLQVSPVWTIIPTSGGTNHIVAQINPTQYFDSYQLFVKNFQPNFQPLSYWFLNLKYYPMTNAQFYHKVGTKEYGFTLPAMSEDALKDKAMNLAVNIFDQNGAIDYTLAKEVTGL
jgi:hypothetical protein